MRLTPKQLRKVALKIAGDSTLAEDLVQDAWVDALERGKKEPNLASLRRVSEHLKDPPETVWGDLYVFITFYDDIEDESLMPLDAAYEVREAFRGLPYHLKDLLIATVLLGETVYEYAARTGALVCETRKEFEETTRMLRAKWQEN